jgi:hypothetical protein
MRYCVLKKYSNIRGKTMVELKFVDIEPNISDEERKRNIEIFVDSLYRAFKDPYYKYCKYDIETEVVTLYYEK